MLKLNVGFNRKIGEANYGSRGASVNLELELDSGLVGDPERLQQRIRQLFDLAKASVNEELQGDAPSSSGDQHGHTSGNNGDGQASAARPANNRACAAGRTATTSQVRAIHAIAQRVGIDLEDTLRVDFDVTRPQQLTVTQASQLIDRLKGIAEQQADEPVAGARR